MSGCSVTAVVGWETKKKEWLWHGLDSVTAQAKPRPVFHRLGPSEPEVVLLHVQPIAQQKCAERLCGLGAVSGAKVKASRDKCCPG